MLPHDYSNNLKHNGEVTKTRIAFVGTKTLNEIGKKVAATLNSSLELTFIDSTFNDATDQVKSLIRQAHIQGVISSGGNEFCLAKAIPDIPVTHIPIDGFDLISALAKAANIADKIALLSYDNHIASLLHPIGCLLNRPLILSGFQDVESARNEIIRVKNEGCAIVGSSLIVDLAREAGIMAHHYYSERNVTLAMHAAILNRPQTASVNACSNDSNPVIDGFFEPALLLNQNGQLVAFNHAARELWGDKYNIDLREKISRQLSALSQVSCDKSKAFSNSEIAQVSNGGFALTSIPFRLNNGERGTLILYKPSTPKQPKSNTEASAKYQIGDFLGHSNAAKHIQTLSLRYAKAESTILITGESGTGKELIAQGIHNLSKRRNSPFIAVNTSAMQESLIESELFGYEDGTFTGSKKGGKTGLFEAANGGTIFLDEIGDMPLALQTRLLRVLQEKEILKLGSHQPISINVRVIAATNKNLKAEIDAGNFREDLYYRLNILDITVPPLRQRREDILPISKLFLQKLSAHEEGNTFLNEHLEYIVQAFGQYDWPGNVRELQNIIERLFVYYQCQPEVSLPDFETLQSICPELHYPKNPVAASKCEAHPESLKQEQKAHEISHIKKVLEECDNNVSIAAQKLGVSRTTLWRKTKNNCLGNL